MINKREKDTNWAVRTAFGELFVNTDGAQLAVLMDLRDELKKLNALLHCDNAVAMPFILRQIEMNTRKAKRKCKR